MKLIIKDKLTLLVLFSSILLFSFMLHSLSLSAEDKSALPIGIVDYDHSQNSKELIDRIKEIPALSIIEGSEKKLEILLLDEMINAVFVIEEGYEQQLQRGKVNEVITMYFLTNKKSASIISDIIAGEMMHSICYYKCLNLYESISFAGVKHTKLEYEDYIQNLQKTSSDFDFAFQMVYVNKENTVINAEPISNVILYKQMIIGILGIFISFIAMFIISSTVKEKELGVSERLRISRFHAFKQDCGNFIALVLTEGVICLIFTYLICSQAGINDKMLWISLYLLLLLTAAVMGGVFILISMLVKSMIAFQLISSILILTSGGLGFYAMISGLYDGIVNQIFKFIPNSWLIQGFTDIIVYNDVDYYINEAHQMLLIMGIIVIISIIFIDLFRIKSTRKYAK